MQGKTSVLFGAISIVVITIILAVFVMVPPSAQQAQTDMLRKTVDESSRRLNQVLGVLGGPTIKVDGKTPSLQEPGNETNITVLEARQQNATVPERLDQIHNDLKDALDKAPEARDDSKAGAYSLVGQVLAAKAQYHLRSAENAAVAAAAAMGALDTGISSVQERLTGIGQNTPLTQTNVTAADKMKTAAQENVTRLQSDIADKETEIEALKAQRAEYLAKMVKCSNEASELRTRSDAAVRDQRRKLQEDSFVQEKLANKAGLDAEDTQTKVDAAKASVVLLNIELTGAKASVKSATAVLDGFADNREKAKARLDKQKLAINTVAGEIAKSAEALIAACDKIDAGQELAIKQFADAREAMKQFQQHSPDSSAEAIGAEGAVLMGKARASLAVVSTRHAVQAAGERLKALWETAELEGSPPKNAEMTAFAAKAQGDQKAAADDIDAAAKLYEEATTRAVEFKWSYQCSEFQARRERHKLTGDADDETRANLLKEQLEELRGFPYVDSVLQGS